MTPTIDVRATHEVGRKARLELVFGCKSGKTVLTHGYAEPPLRVGRCQACLKRFEVTRDERFGGYFFYR